MTFALTFAASVVAVGLVIAVCCGVSVVIDNQEVRK